MYLTIASDATHMDVTSIWTEGKTLTRYQHY